MLYRPADRKEVAVIVESVVARIGLIKTVLVDRRQL